MNRTLFAALLVSTFGVAVQSAQAADMPVKAPMAPMAPAIMPYNWTGFYVGAQGGYGWGSLDVTNVNGNAAFPAGFQHSTDITGGFGGLTAGFNYQFPSSNWLVGIEGDISWGDINGDSSEVSPVTPATRITSSHDKVDWFATATGRLGYAYSNWLFFAKGGAAWAHKESNSDTTNPATGGTLIASTTGEDTRTGWTVGGGVEWGFWQNWSAKIEYDYMDFGTKTEAKNATYFGGTGLNPLLKDVDFRMSVFRVGINYRFGGMH